MTDRTKLSQLAHNAGLDLFDYDGCRYASLAVTCAQQLEGKTHFMSDRTRKFFNAQVHMLHGLFGGLVLGMVESVKHGDDARQYRATFVDCSGTVIYRDTLSEGFSTQKDAIKDFWRVLGTLTEQQVFDKLMAREMSAATARMVRIHTAQVKAKETENVA